MRDEEYCAMLATFARLDLQGHTRQQLMQKLDLGGEEVTTAYKRLQQTRVATVESAELFDMRQRSIEMYRLVQSEAWKRLQSVPAASRVSADLLNQIAAAEREIVRLQGTLAVLKDDDQYDRGVHVEIINNLTERVSRIPRSTRTAEVPLLPEQGGSPGSPVLLGTVGQGESIAADWREVADVDDPSWERLGEDENGG